MRRARCGAWFKKVPGTFLNHAERFKQIELQSQGVQAFRRADIAEALGISDQQKQDLQQVIDEMRKKSAELQEQSMGLFQANRDQGRDLSDCPKSPLSLGERVGVRGSW